MDFKKFLEMSVDANKPETTEAVNESTETTVGKTGSKTLKEYFLSVEKNKLDEALAAASGQKPTPIPVVGKEGDKAVTQPGFLSTSSAADPATKALIQAVASLPPGKAQIVVPTLQQQPQTQTTGQPAQSGLTTAGGGTAMKEEQVDEKWAGDAEVKATGQYSGKTVEELKSMLSKLKKSGPHAAGSPANKRMKQIMFAIRAKKGWKGGVEEAQIDEKAKNPYAIGMAVAKKAAGITKKHATDLPKSVVVKGHEIAKKIKKKEQTDEAEIPHAGPDYGAGIGAGRSATTLESKKVTESMNTLEAAYHEGKSHGLSKHGYACRYNEGSEEHRRYHEGFKEGLDECYGLQPNRGLVVGETVPATVPGMADQAEEAGMDEGNAFTAALAKTDKGDKFSVGGKTFTDTSNYDSKIDEYAFESLDQKLNALLNETTETVTEGVNVSMSQGQGGMHGDKLDDSVSVSATGDDAAKLLAFIKQVGIGGLGGSEASDAEVHADAHPIAAIASDYGAPKFGGHDDMKALLAKVTGDEEGSEEGAEDEESEEGVEEAHACNECGMMEAECGCDKEVVDEVETPDQETDEMAEDAAADAEEAETTADEDAEAEEDSTKPASGGATNESLKLDEWANEAGKDGTEASFERDIEFMTKVIAGGLNKPKSTGQTTIPVIAHQDARTGDEDVAAWKKLAGLGK